MPDTWITEYPGHSKIPAYQHSGVDTIFIPNDKETEAEKLNSLSKPHS